MFRKLLHTQCKSIKCAIINLKMSFNLILDEDCKDSFSFVRFAIRADRNRYSATSLSGAYPHNHKVPYAKIKFWHHYFQILLSDSFKWQFCYFKLKCVLLHNSIYINFSGDCVETALRHWSDSEVVKLGSRRGNLNCFAIVVMEAINIINTTESIV